MTKQIFEYGSSRQKVPQKKQKILAALLAVKLFILEMEITVKREGRRRKFIAYCSGDNTIVSWLSYKKILPNAVDFYHTETVEECQGKGIAKQVVLMALEWADNEGFEVIPSCSYVEKVMKERS